MKDTTRANILMWITAMIWGFAFVAQRAGMEDIGPFAYSSIRFALGGMSLLPLVFYYHRKGNNFLRKDLWLSGLLAGSVLFCGASAQQVGIVNTPAGKAGFITGLYVVMVPVIGLLWKRKTSLPVWIGAALSVVGMYFLSIHEGIKINKGDMWVLAGAFFWANHVLVIAWLSPKYNSVQLAVIQFFTVSVLSGLMALGFETIGWSNVHGALWPILYGGLMSVGIAYTLQVVAQKHAHPAYASIVLSLETVFAALGGWLVLSESFTLRELFGSLLIFTGILVAQWQEIFSAWRKTFN
ncbi:MAG: DMT family transporter [Bacteroidales bacterium]|jgi:drug/metabolite transporter (DMT)-like permease|nr:DMT family transporter [Bacteroidales bacterium]NPV37363.1 DMT family transporter [Bacteroidales bacterium]